MFTVILFALGTYVVNANQGITENSSFEEIQEVLQKYIDIDESGDPKFNFEKASEDGQSDYVISLGEDFNDLSDSYIEYDDTELVTPYASMPVWGNWCGPGHGGGVPKGVLDSLCMTHDLCYAQLGYFNCTCDKGLLVGISTSYVLMKSDEKRAANLIAAYFAIAPCKK